MTGVFEVKSVEATWELAKEVAAVFARNKAERHLRGGEATRRRYAERRHE